MGKSVRLRFAEELNGLCMGKMGADNWGRWCVWEVCSCLLLLVGPLGARGGGGGEQDELGRDAVGIGGQQRAARGKGGRCEPHPPRVDRAVVERLTNLGGKIRSVILIGAKSNGRVIHGQNWGVINENGGVNQTKWGCTIPGTQVLVEKKSYLCLCSDHFSFPPPHV